MTSGPGSRISRRRTAREPGLGAAAPQLAPAPGASAVPDIERPPPILTRRFGFLVGGHFLQALGYSSMLLLPLYLEWLGATRAEIGAAMAASSVGGLLAGPFVGWALDVLGRKPTLIAGTLVMAASMAAIGAVSEMGPLVLGVRLLFGIGAGALGTGFVTLAGDVVPVSRRTEGLALFGISGLVPLVVSPFADRLGLEPADLRWFLPAVGAVVLLSMGFQAAIPEPQHAGPAARLTLRTVGQALAARRLRPTWLAVALFAGLVAVFMAFATVTASSRGAAHPATVWLTYAGGSVGIRLVGARLPDRLGQGRVASVALLTYASGLAVTAIATSDVGFGLAGLLAGLGHGFCFPILASQVMGRSPDAMHGVAMATFAALSEGSRLVMAPAFGKLADATSDGTMLFSAAGFTVAGTIAWRLAERRAGDPPKAGRPPEGPLPAGQ